MKAKEIDIFFVSQTQWSFVFHDWFLNIWTSSGSQFDLSLVNDLDYINTWYSNSFQSCIYSYKCRHWHEDLMAWSVCMLSPSFSVEFCMEFYILLTHFSSNITWFLSVEFLLICLSLHHHTELSFFKYI